MCNKSKQVKTDTFGEFKWIEQNQYKEGIFFANIVNGCYNKCPCARWVNCGAYVDITAQQSRLKAKEINQSIHDWFDTYFRPVYEHSYILGNG